MPESKKPKRADVLRYEHMREKVLQWMKDVWRPYHGSTRHREDADGNQMVEKKKTGGHMPLNAAVMNLSMPRTERQHKLSSSRDLFMRELYRLACGTPEEVVMFCEIQDLFRDYGAGDSDYDHLREKARLYPESERKLTAVDNGIRLITTRLIEKGITSREFWADFPHGGPPTGRTKAKNERYRRYYLAFLEECAKLEAEKRAEYRERGKEPPAVIRVRSQAARNVAEREGTTDRTVREAVSEFESGYLDVDEAG